jgi:hypothetical protein
MGNEYKGRIVKIFDIQTGEGKNGTWYKREFMIETDGEYPKKIKFDAWKEELCNRVGSLPIGALVNVSFNLEAREYKDKWYNDTKAWKVEALDKATTQQPAAPTPETGMDTPIDDSLPF